MTTVLLIHGGLWEDLTADLFWHRPGIVAGLQSHGLHVLAPDRAHRAPSWTAEVQHLAATLPDHPVTIVAGSNGCSAAVRLTLARPDLVERLLLAWPATAGDPAADAQARDELTGLGAPSHVVDALLTGQTLRGTTDADLTTITAPIGLLPSLTSNPIHLRHTVDALAHALPQSVELPGSPEPPRPDFPPHAESVIQTIARFAAP